MLLTALAIAVTVGGLIYVLSWFVQDMKAHDPCLSYENLRSRARYRRNPYTWDYASGRSYAMSPPYRFHKDTPKGGRAPGYKS